MSLFRDLTRARARARKREAEPNAGSYGSRTKMAEGGQTPFLLPLLT